MNMQEKIEGALAHANMSKTEMGKKAFNVTQQTICTRISRGKFTKEELEQIAHIMGAEYVCYFEFPDGKKF